MRKNRVIFIFMLLLSFGFLSVHAQVTIKDIDGNVYKTITIGKQVWMAENLKTTKYRTGENISNVTSNTSWAALTGGAWCDYNNDAANGTKYGHLYNWFTANDNRNIAPAGWHIPSNAEWAALIKNYSHFGTGNVLDSLTAGKALKETGTANWAAANSATNEFAFSALPGGYRTTNLFDSLGYLGAWWTATLGDNANALSRQMRYNSDGVSTVNSLKNSGFSIRCTLDFGFPIITGDSVVDIKETSATIWWYFSNYVGSSITEQGVCYSTSPMPTKDNNKSSGKITGLNPNTKYYARAYATNSFGTSYGKEISFTTLPFNVDANFAKIYSSLGLTGNQQPAGDPDIPAVDESFIDFVRGIWNMNELSTDEAICAWNDYFIPELNFNNWTSQNAQVRGIYNRLLFNVSVCNYFISQTSTKTDDISLKQRAEARFIRALNYYYLLDMFGKVPFTEGNSFANTTQLSRTELFNYIDTELAQCETNLSNPLQAPYGRADKAANWLLHSRLLLNAEVYTGSQRWADAATYSKKVMDSGYSLCPTFKQLFMADNDGSGTVNKARQEIILPIVADGITAKSWGSSNFLIASTRTSGMVNWGTNQGWAGNRARATLVKKFFPTGSSFFSNNADLSTAILASLKDSRALFDKGSVSSGYTVTTASNFRDGYQVIKFSNLRADGAATSSIQFPDMDVPFLRAAEAYLTYAEAIYRTGNTSEALTVINQLRTRAGAVAKTSIDLAGILDEKAREFFFEGQRRTDLIRFGNYGGGSYNWDWKGGLSTGTGFDAHFNIFPIPQTELNTNQKLLQNPGY